MQMAIDFLPAVQSILEQQNLLEQVFKQPLEARLAYARMADKYIFPNGIGETITKTRVGLYPLSAGITPLNPVNNTGLENGLSDVYWPSEQYQIAINEYALSTTTNIKQDYTLIQRTFLQNVVNLGESAGRTFDALCATYLHKAYDGGNTFCTAVNSTTSQHVDNVYGLDTAFSATNSPGLPSAVSVSNPLAVNLFDASGNFIQTLSVTGVAYDSTNSSTANVGGVAYGASGTLTFAVAPSSATAAGYVIQAADGSVVIRTSATHNSRYNLAAGDIITLEYLAQARALLEARNVPALPSGNYLCIIDPRLWPLLLKDTAFNYATMGQMGEGYFATGMVNRTLGLEFINSNMVPAYFTGSSNTSGALLQARHAVVCGMGALIKGTFQGHIDASRDAQQMDGSDIRFVNEEDISLITRAPLDKLREFVSQTWNWVGGFVAPTDVTSTPLIIPTTDYARYKRAVIIESADH